MPEGMTPEQFVEWLKGYLDGIPKDKLDYNIFDKIKEKLIFVKKEI